MRSLLCRSSTSALSNANIKKIVKPNFKQQKMTSHRMKKSVSIENTSVRIQQWLHSGTLFQSINTRHRLVKHREKTKQGVSNNAVNITESQVSLRQTLGDQLIKQLNGWHCLQILYHHPCHYTLGMSLSQISRAIMSNSQEIFILSTQIQPFLKRQSTNQVGYKHDGHFSFHISLFPFTLIRSKRTLKIYSPICLFLSVVMVSILYSILNPKLIYIIIYNELLNGIELIIHYKNNSRFEQSEKQKTLI